MDFGDAIGYGVPPRPDFWIGGQTTGTAQIDLETGQVSSAKIAVKVDLDTKFQVDADDKVVELGVKAVGTLEVSLERTVP